MESFFLKQKEIASYKLSLNRLVYTSCYLLVAKRIYTLLKKGQSGKIIFFFILKRRN